MTRWMALCALLGGCAVSGGGDKPPAPASVAASAASPSAAAPASGSAPASVVIDPRALPPSDRIFFAAGRVLGADGTRLWARAASAPETPNFEVDGPGVVHAVASVDLGDGEALYVARGVGRGHLDAPLVLQRIDPTNGQVTELWRRQSERNEPAGMSAVDVNGDGRVDLGFAYYESKYMVRTRHLLAGGGIVEGEAVRMGTSRTYADVNGDKRVDEILGRVYGDAKDVPGDLRVFSGGAAPVTVPTDNGVKSLLWRAIGAAEAPALYFCDGWVANYGQAAKARVRRVQFTRKGPGAVETLAASPDEFTFFALDAADVDGDGHAELIAQGDKRVTVFADRGGSSLEVVRTVPIEPVLNVAVGVDAAGRAALYVPSRAGTRRVALAPTP